MSGIVTHEWHYQMLLFKNVFMNCDKKQCCCVTFVGSVYLGLDECYTFNPPAYYGVENKIDTYSKDK